MTRENKNFENFLGQTTFFSWLIFVFGKWMAWYPLGFHDNVFTY
jgi:hypothetical protein